MDRRPVKAQDSPRWCNVCDRYGDHHTDRHHLYAPRRADTAEGNEDAAG